MRDRVHGIHVVDDVSIRARPHGRAMRCFWRPRPNAASSFNPRPASRSGDARTRNDKRNRDGGFNPRPASRSGDARVCSTSMVVGIVSIRARPHGRAMPPRHRRVVVAVHVSIRARPHGRAMPRVPHQAGKDYGGFNPRPASRSGDATTQAMIWNPISCFNPRPASRSGDAGWCCAGRR